MPPKVKITKEMIIDAAFEISELPILLTLKQKAPLIDDIEYQSRGFVLSTQKFIEIFKCFL